MSNLRVTYMYNYCKSFDITEYVDRVYLILYDFVKLVHRKTLMLSISLERFTTTEKYVFERENDNNGREVRFSVLSTTYIIIILYAFVCRHFYIYIYN